jgi:hypothetical protein
VHRLDLVRAGASPDLDDAFARSLRDCYGRHGVDGAAKPIAPDVRDQVRMLVVRDRSDTLVAGARVFGRRGAQGFPAEAALAAFPLARARLAAMARTDTVELAALWTSPASKGTGVSRLVAQAAIACAIAMGKERAFTFSHQHFEHVLFRVGLHPAAGFPPMPFPTAAYQSRIYAVDLRTLAGATADDQELIQTMADEFGAGIDALPIQPLARIEQGEPLLRITSQPHLRNVRKAA